ncbi:MAG: hypothetical protein IPH44_21505 [Myxococcales bacterium]|nr:hypothetical protein [Myxococcales bacterium]MBK7191932.1 hypothetical protein [Myxococcales bacterium]
MRLASWVCGTIMMLTVGCDDPGPAPAACEWVAESYGECSNFGRCGGRGGMCCYVSDDEWVVLIVDPGRCDAGVPLPDAGADDAAPGDAAAR